MFPDCGKNLVEYKYGHFCPMCSLETKLAVCSLQVNGESRQQDLLKYLGESCGNCNYPVIVNICMCPQAMFCIQQGSPVWVALKPTFMDISEV